VSVTLKKNVIVITASQRGKKREGEDQRQGHSVARQVVAPSVRLSAIRKSANGGIPKRALSVANAAERKTKGAMILKIWGWGNRIQPTSEYTVPLERPERLTRRVAIKNGLNLGTSRYTGSK